jgi:micrococcal nuclease
MERAQALCEWLAWVFFPPRTPPEAIPRHEKCAFQKRVRVASVYDGDTFTAIARIDGRWQRRQVRCVGYDSPELRTSDPGEKARALRARDYLRRLLPTERSIVLHVDGLDKYGRWLGRWPAQPLDAAMIAAGHGVPYSGGKKTPA